MFASIRKQTVATFVFGVSVAAVSPMHAQALFEYSFPTSWDGAAALVTDLSAAGNDAVPEGAPGTPTPLLSNTIPPGASGGAQSVDTTDGGFATEAALLLENTVVAGAGGFQFETSFLWDGTTDDPAPAIQKIIDYAGTEFIQLQDVDTDAGTATLRFGFNDDDLSAVAAGNSLTMTVEDNVWYDVRAVFSTLGNDVAEDGSVTGVATMTVNGDTRAEVVTKTTAGDDLNRPMAIGAFPLNTAIIELHGLIYDPSATLGAPDFEMPNVDYNNDLIVNAADYTVAVDTLGSTTDLRADGSGNGTVGPEDIALWAAFFGAEIPEGSLTGAPVPEPTSLWLWLFALACSRLRYFGR